MASLINREQIRDVVHNKNRSRLKFVQDILGPIITNMPNGIFLDLGCGSGVLTRMIGAENPSLPVVGADIASHGHNRLTMPIPDNVNFINFNPFKVNEAVQGARIGGVLISGVLHHIDPLERHRFYDDLRKIVTPETKIVIVEHNVNFGSVERRAISTIDNFANKGMGITEPSHYYSGQELANELEEHDFAITDTSSVGRTYFTVPFPGGVVAVTAEVSNGLSVPISVSRYEIAA